MTNVPLHLVKYLQSGRVIVAQQEASEPGRYAFVGVRPHKGPRSPLEPDYEQAPWSYSVHRFEVDASLVELDIGDESLINLEEHEFTSLDALDALLGEWVGDPSLFQKAGDNPFYPF